MIWSSRLTVSVLCIANHTKIMKVAAIFVMVAAALPMLCFSHSVMMEPQGMSSQECRINPGNCAGPCDISKFTGNNAANPWTRYFPPSNPVPRKYRRGEEITVKYTRNNHGPGGFIRHTLVPLADMMNKAVHARNAFHYSCWGAHLKLATSDELGKDKFGFSLVSDDGKDHNFKPGYYTVKVTIPPVVPDGQYIFGHLWLGGTSGDVTSNTNQVPRAYSHFTDYWSCAFITVQGGAPLASSYKPIFVNDYIFDKSLPGAEGWENGCMAKNDAPGMCSGEPCTGPDGFYRKPRPFKNGSPRALTPADFGGDNSAANPDSDDSGNSDSTIKSGEVSWKGRASCTCLIYDKDCSTGTAQYSNGCKAATAGVSQPNSCKKSCCDMCKTENSYFCSAVSKSC